MAVEITGPDGRSVLKAAELIIWRSPDGEKGWKIIKPDEVPDWVKHPDVMGRLVAGDMVTDQKHSPFWYRAEPTPSAQEVARIHGNALRHEKIAARKRRRRAH